MEAEREQENKRERARERNDKPQRLSGLILCRNIRRDESHSRRRIGHRCYLNLDFLLVFVQRSVIYISVGDETSSHGFLKIFFPNHTIGEQTGSERRSCPLHIKNLSLFLNYFVSSQMHFTVWRNT